MSVCIYLFIYVYVSMCLYIYIHTCNTGHPYAAKRKDCCSKYRLPLIRSGLVGGFHDEDDECPENGFQEGEFDPRAVIWKLQHPNDTPCEKCPGCITFRCLPVLSKIANDARMLQVSKLVNEE